VPLVGLLLLGPLAYLLYRALGGATSLVDRDVIGTGEPGESFLALPWLLIAFAAALAALAGWWISDRARRSGDGEAHEVERLRRSLAEQRRMTRDLSSRMSRLQHSEGTLGGREDVRSLVLLAAINLLDAEKGLLLSNRDGDGDGNLDVVAHHGFADDDPQKSGLVQRFGDQVMDRDEIVRIGRDELPDIRTAPADDEIENLVAIPIYISDEFHGVVIVANGEAMEHDDEVLVALGDHAGAILENSRLHGELRGSYLATVKMLADAIEVKDPFLRGHSEEVSGLVRAMARRLNMEGRDREQLIFGSLLHDVGKIGVSERILLKPGPLTDEEYSAVKLHPRIGYRLVAQVPLLKPVAPAILHHHERFDGTGYPSGLSGERIPLEARVIAIIDAFSAMISDRPYQPAMPVTDALAELERCAGTHFDPKLVEIFAEEVRAGIPDDGESGVNAAEALDDPELQALRDEGSASVGMGTFASTDSLTLLASHSYFRRRLEGEVARAGLDATTDQLGVVVIEATNLADLNRERGYDATDRLIQELARQVDTVAVDCGGMAGRDGGSRLVIAACGADESVVARVEERLRERAPDDLELAIGRASWREGQSAEDLIAAVAPV
jgi:HD-GYP domain-containing protein (c-di-GMP phosphodiesterase class II)/GGDEF domain-containing protein